MTRAPSATAEWSTLSASLADTSSISTYPIVYLLACAVSALTITTTTTEVAFSNGSSAAHHVPPVDMYCSTPIVPTIRRPLLPRLLELHLRPLLPYRLRPLARSLLEPR